METVKIEKMTYGIEALGRMDGKVVFVPYGAPQDELEIKITETKTDYCRAEMVRIAAASPQRQKSPCVHFPECGGCHWLHLLPEVQRREKESYLNYLLKSLSPKRIHPIEALPEQRYRNKMELKPHMTDEGKLLLGNYHFRSYDVVDIPNCIVQIPANMDFYRNVKDFLEKEQSPDMIQNIRQIAVRTLGAQQHAVISLKTAPEEPVIDKWRSFFNSREAVAKLELNTDDMSFLTLVREKEDFIFMKRPWVVSPRSFFQNNLDGAEAIYYTLQSIYSSSPYKGKFIDLYCGVGIQTMLLESHFEEVVGIESNEVSQRDAIKNQRGRRAGQIRFHAKKAEAVFGTPLTKGVIAAVHMNPPRTGLSQRVLRGMTGVKPRMITYLSCNPNTFKRDAQSLKQMGYQLERVYAFDLFPGTFHLEVLGVFTR
jgi:23S rRNA (uracil-5-)-methyltransferase RumA